MGKRSLFSAVTLLCFLVASLFSLNTFAKDRTEILVGTINSLTGANAMTGAEHRWAYKQAVKDINAKGGVYVKELGKKLPMRLIFADDKSTPDQAAAAMERLIKLDKIDLGLSSNITPLNIAAGTVCEKYHVYYQIVVSFVDSIEAENFHWVSDFFARTTTIGEIPFKIWENQLPKDQRPKHPALLMEDNMDGQGFGKGFIASGKKYGYKFEVNEPFAPGTKDFSSHILKYKYAKVDALIALMPPTDAITFLRQLNEQGVVIPYIQGFKGFWPREFEEAMGPLANYVIHDGFWSSKNGQPGSAELQKRFIKEFKNDSVSVGLSYANPQILAMAIEKVGSVDSKKIRDYIFSGKAEFKHTIMGDVKYNKKGLAEMQFLALQWWNGERMPVYPPMPSVWKLKLRPKK